MITDMSHLPLPFIDNSFDEIHLNDVLEQMPDVISFMEEIYRIGRPNSKVTIRVVIWNSHYAAMDPTHLLALTKGSFDFFGGQVIVIVN